MSVVCDRPALSYLVQFPWFPLHIRRFVDLGIARRRDRWSLFRTERLRPVSGPKAFLILGHTKNF
jgi:hypothetical protein